MPTEQITPQVTGEKVDFERIHIFNAGTFNGIPNTAEHLKSMEEFAADHPNVYADLKLDHIDDKGKRDSKFKVFENFPYVLATIKNLKASADGSMLFGDYVNVFEPIKHALKDKLLRTHSAEIFYDVTSRKTGKKYAAVLGAVAILPAGKFPALMDVFQPYMYKLQSALTEQITYKNKLVCNFKTGETMTEQDYKIKVKKYTDAGVTVKPFTDYMKMLDEEKNLYMQGLEKELNADKSAKPFEKEGQDMPQEKTTETQQVSADFSAKLKQLDKAIADANLMKANYEKGIDKVTNQFSEEAKHYKQAYSDLMKARKEDEVNTLISNLTDTDNPKLPVALKERAYAALMSLDVEKKVNYSLDGKEQESTSYELVSNLLNALPEIKQVYNTESIVAGEGDLTVKASELQSGETPEGALAAKKFEAKYSDKDLANMTDTELTALYEKEGLIA